jgi:hypothetical protein
VRKLLFPGSLKPLADEKAFHALLRPLFRQDWVVYAKDRSEDPNMSFITWPATHIALPYPITGS